MVELPLQYYKMVISQHNVRNVCIDETTLSIRNTKYFDFLLSFIL